MSSLQTYQLWIGFGFALLLVIFFIVAFFKARELTDDQRSILKFLSALCAAFAGALITGDALFKMEGTIGQTQKFAITGAAGFALFFTVWFFFPKVARFPEGFNFSVPEGWTFQQAVDAFARQDNAVVNYTGFTPEELSAPLKAWQLPSKNIRKAISQLRSLTASPNQIRNYDVDHQDSTYLLRIRA
jgi:hypothetical protein